MRSSPSRARAAAVAVLLTAWAASAAGSRITVARRATVAGPTIRLADIATLDGEPAEALGSLDLGPAPRPGEHRALAGAVVLQALRREAGALDDIAYTIPATVDVRRASQQVGEPEVRQIIEDFLVQTLGEAADDAVLRAVELPDRIVIPTGEYQARVIPPGRTPLVGRVRLQVEFTIDGRSVRTAWVGADIGLWGPVVVARRAIARGEPLTEADLTLDRRDLSHVPRGVLSDLEAVVGRVARAPIVAFVPIRREQVETPAAVRRGDAVLLVAERKGLRITAPGEVHADAGLGEQVRVINRATRKLLTGRVVDARTVGVDF